VKPGNLKLFKVLNPAVQTER